MKYDTIRTVGEVLVGTALLAGSGCATARGTPEQAPYTSPQENIGREEARELAVDPLQRLGQRVMAADPYNHASKSERFPDGTLVRVKHHSPV